MSSGIATNFILGKKTTKILWRKFVPFEICKLRPDWPKTPWIYHHFFPVLSFTIFLSLTKTLPGHGWLIQITVPECLTSIPFRMAMLTRGRNAKFGGTLFIGLLVPKSQDCTFFVFGVRGYYFSNACSRGGFCPGKKYFHFLCMCVGPNRENLQEYLRVRECGGGFAFVHIQWSNLHFKKSFWFGSLLPSNASRLIAE